MNRYQLISMIAAICFASTANAAYEVELANIYACAWCNNDLSGYNDEEYDNFHNAGFTCGDPNDCMHFVSQILQHGCMGICVSYCGERIDPAIYDLDHFCVRCQSDYRTVYRNPTMTSCVEHGLEVFPNSSYWFAEGPFTNTTFLAHPNNGGPQYLTLLGDIVLWRRPGGSGHATWCGSDEWNVGPWMRCFLTDYNGLHYNNFHYDPSYPTHHCPSWNYGDFGCRGALYDQLMWYREAAEYYASLPSERQYYIFHRLGTSGPPMASGEAEGQWSPEDGVHHVSGLLHVSYGNSLEMLPGTEVEFDEGAALIVDDGANLMVYGTTSNPVVFRSTTPGETWGGITIDGSTGTRYLLNLSVDGAAVGLLVRNTAVHAEYISVTNSSSIGAAFIGATGEVYESSFSGNDRCGTYVINSDVSFTNCDFSDNGKGGLRIWRAPNCELENCNIDNNGSLWTPPSDAFWSGVQVLQGGISLKCNSISGNYGPGLSLFSVTYADLGDNVGRNVIEDNMQILGQSYSSDDGQILLGGGIVNMECGLNTIRDVANTNMLVTSLYDHAPATGWDASYNYWGTTNVNNIEARLDNDPEFEPIADRVWDCQEVITPPCDETEEELLFRGAWLLEREAQFLQALTDYESYVNLYPQGKHVNVVLDRILFCKDALKYSWLDTRNYFLDLAADSSKDSNVVVLCKSNAAWCLAEMGDYDGAYFELDSLLDHSTTEYIQLTMELKLLLLELQQDEIDLAFDDSKKQDLSRLDNRPQDVVNKLTEIDSRLDLLLQSSAATRKRPGSSSPAVSYDFNLYSNYPNPFNSSTRIRFSLPSAGQATIRVYDVTGRLVTTLLDDMVAAGHHQVVFDGSGISSGVYFCQLKAGGELQTRKMVLIK